VPLPQPPHERRRRRGRTSRRGSRRQP
jgi:hypothetical protein